MRAYIYTRVLVGQRVRVACIRIHSISQACELFLFYIPSVMSATGCSLHCQLPVHITGNSHDLAVYCPPNILYTSLGHKPHRLFKAPQDIKARYPSLYKWEKQSPKIGCHPNRNSYLASSSLSPTPPTLLTNNSGLCHFILSTWTSGLVPPHSGQNKCVH